MLSKRSQLVAYHVTRVTAYTLLGVVAGLGSALILRSWLQPLAPYLGVVLGSVMLTYAVVELGRVVAALIRHRSFQPSLALHRPGKIPATILRLTKSTLPKPVTLAIATALLPCGFLYAALTQAALLAHPFYSGASMAVFALSTGPALLFGSFALSGVGRRFPKAQPLIVALALVITSGGLLVRAVSQPHVHDASQVHLTP